MDRQLASEISTALLRLPVMTIGSYDDAASLISRKSLDLASVAVNVGIIDLKYITDISDNHSIQIDIVTFSIIYYYIGYAEILFM